MAFYNDFLKALAAGDGVKDYSHANKVFRDNNYALAPKNAFLYYVVFEFNQAVRRFTDFNRDQSKTYDIGVLVKNVQLPGFELALQEKNQYGKHTYTQTRINYNPVQIAFHDDMANTITEFWANYYRYYYADGNKDRAELTYESSNKYDGNYDTNKYGYKGFTNAGDSVQPFLNSIKIYSLHQKEFTEYTLVNPIINSLQHGTHDASASSGLLETTISVRYQSVLYAKGGVTRNDPAGFLLRYDLSPSPISSSTTSVLGPGGLVDTIGGIITDIGNGDIIGAGIKLLKGKEAFEDVNIGDVLKEEAIGIVGDIARGTSGSIVPSIATSVASNPSTSLNEVPGSGQSNQNINVNGQN